jgi:uncharacterized protein (DUF2141 family)
VVLATVLGGTAAPVHAGDGHHEVPDRLKGMAVSGRALDQVAARIDPSRPLGYCAPTTEQPRIKVVLPNVRNSKGNVRVSLYGPDADQWVGKAKGGKLIRFDIPARQGRMEVCLPLPYGRGIYAIGLYHDENADEDYGFTSEGYGFSNNAKAGLFGPASHKEAAFSAGAIDNEVEIRLRY